MIERAKTFVCDAGGCGAVERVAWQATALEPMGPPPGWLEVTADGRRREYCPKHEAVIRPRRTSFSPAVLELREEPKA